TLDHSGSDYYERYQKAIEEYAAECAIAKVFCSEQLDMVVDEAVQIHGGYGYISEYAVERYYRDSRIQRIFEGTNEINRILIPTTLFRRADGGSLDLWNKVEEAQEKMIMLEVADNSQGKEEFTLEISLLANLKVLFLGVLGAVAHVRGSQEIMLALADMVITIFALESVLLRAEQVFASASDKKKEQLRGVVKVVAFERSAQFHLAASRCGGYAGLTEYRNMLRKNMQRLSYYPVEGLLAAKQLLAETSRDAGRYTL
ncbi:MAG TPA: acyl-CoA dehydrogenase family protein, partial [Geobacteraceae bacterium]|nr:acyl-CoA dehydrogenase family protein [Geobacteraceae bacterium]